MKIVLVTDEISREARKTRDHLHKLGVPFGTARLDGATVRVTNGDRVMEWVGYLPHMIRKHCPLGGL